MVNEAEVKVTVRVHKSTAKEGNVGWELTVTDGADQTEIDAAIDRAIAGHRRLQAALQTGEENEPHA